MKWYLIVLNKYAVFKGRARCKEYWSYTFSNLFFIFCAVIIDRLMGISIGEINCNFISILYMLAVLIPTLAVTVRRLHDSGKSGWWILIMLLPVAGIIWIFILMLLKGDPGTNRFGKDPKLS